MPQHSPANQYSPSNAMPFPADPPVTRYAQIGELSIAYQVIGAGPLDMVHIPSWVSNVEENWNEPGYARFLNRLAPDGGVVAGTGAIVSSRR